MTYISIVDELGIDLEYIKHLDHKKIIRLQKQLKAKIVLENTSHLNELTTIIDLLKDPDTRKCYIFVEEHAWLKNLLLGNFNAIRTPIAISNIQTENLGALRQFLTPYLNSQLDAFLKRALQRSELGILEPILSQPIYSETIKQHIITFFAIKIEFVIAYIREKRYKKEEYPVAFIEKYNFIRALNLYSDSLTSEINELNSVLCDVFNTYGKNIKNRYFIFAARIMYSLGNIRTNNTPLQEILNDNARIASKYTNPSVSYESGGKRKSSTSVWTVIVVLFIAIRVILALSKTINSSSNSYDNDYNYIRKTTQKKSNTYDTFDFEELQNTSILDESNPNEQIIHFFNSLNAIENGKPYAQEVISTSRPSTFSNPYPEHFNEFYTPTKEDVEEDEFAYTTIKNQTKKELIFFKLQGAQNRAIYIPSGKQVDVVIGTQDIIAFYSGKRFMATSASKTAIEHMHYKTKNFMSDLYYILGTPRDQKRSIVIYPEHITKSKDSTGTKKITYKADSIQIKNIIYRKEKLEDIKLSSKYLRKK